MGLFFISPLAILYTLSINSSRPSFFLAHTPTTGTARLSDNNLISIFIFFFFASSIKLTQTTTEGDSSSICSTKFKFRSRQVASATTTVASGFPKQIKFLAICSSTELDIIEYVPGTSTIRKSFPLCVNFP